MSHTREPWEWSEHTFNAPPFEGTLERECGIYPPLGESGPVAIASGKEDARRIVACVNACTGIPNEVLELDQPQFVKLLNQRAELIAALEKIASRTQDTGLLWWQSEAREALEKVGAGTTATEGHNDIANRRTADSSPGVQRNEVERG